ncbi:hypothetical protein TRFO_40488 [Tritrichomonas foetus]|uniref:START domain-containing protein n=1 Tax=Tritrichomonas foetus TaxID=1144522 RepID=A0A1J4J706_9EUKA|nr:hypothetical protein TRFO_40488 [Tritrichomonas foetus]|eukprot:OHS93221.1 hypothetical protein TRFO_40488 [Tritrichomonas foetus]
MTVAPELIAQYAKSSEELLPKLLELQNSPEWKVSKEEKDIKFYNRTEKSSSYTQVKSVVTIPASMDKVLEVLKPIEIVDSNTPKDKRHGLNERRILFGPQDDEFNTTIFLIELESPGMMVSPRDFVLFRRHYSKDGKEIFLHNSIPNTDLAPEKKGVVRGEMNFQAFIAEKDPENEENIRLTFLVHADPKGKIPAMAYNMVVTNQGYAAKGIRKRAMELSK